MQLDVRLPIGLMFVIFGAILTVFGMAGTDVSEAHKLLGANINVSWGLVQLAFGLLMLWLTWRGRRNAAR